jgi:protocatechuate 3,4-dioxygenase beta subunit
VVETAVTDTTGRYEFDHDQTISQAPQTTAPQTLHFARSRTTWSRSGVVQQFNPALGTLTAVEVINSGTIHGTAKVESTDAMPQTITSQVNALLRLQVPGYGNLDATDTSSQSFQATAFDGTIDYAGGSGRDLGTRQVPVSKSTTLTSAAALALYTGTGTVTLTELASGGTSLIGSSGGNLQSVVTTEGEADVTVIYHYIPTNCLRPGNYSIVEIQPDGYFDGQDTQGNITPLPNSVGRDVISVTLGTENLDNNNFGEVKPASISGHVYEDRNNNGMRQAGEPGIGGVTIQLTGTDDRGQAVNLTQITDASGFYQFLNLRPGQYQLNEQQPANYIDGKDTVGSQGGRAGNDVLTALVLRPATRGTDNDFGELPTSSVSGVVYHDKNNNGQRDAGEAGISGVLITLDGVDFLGRAVRRTQLTVAGGAYSFQTLLPGDYHILEKQPAGYVDGKDTPGTFTGRLVSNDHLWVSLQANQHAVRYNFGERLPEKATNPEHRPPRGSRLQGKGQLLGSAFRAALYGA